jgi:putative Mn2+ efflux pump MntP
MDFITIVLVAIGLTFDSLAVSISTGLMVSHIRFFQALKIAIVFAVFQGFMPLIGWLFGMQVRDFISEYDHWLAFFMLSAIGAKMIYESLRDEKKEFDPTKITVILILAIATSIDALVVGVSFAFIEVNIVQTILIVGGMTLFVTMLGIFLGKNASGYFGNKIEFLGGLILIGIGIKILIEHIYFVAN